MDTCINKNLPEFQNLISLFGNDLAVGLILKNNNYPLQLNPDGSSDLVVKDLINRIIRTTGANKKLATNIALIYKATAMLTNTQLQDYDWSQQQLISNVSKLKSELGISFPIIDSMIQNDIEKQLIKDQAISNDDFLKAPNGSTSNLSEEEWINVRSSEFKNQFGDWETANDLYANVNKVDYSVTDVVPAGVPQKADPSKLNSSLRVYLKDHSKGYYELVKDDETHEYLIQLNTLADGAPNDGSFSHITHEERKTLFNEFIKLIPDGARVAIKGNLTQEGIQMLLDSNKNATKIGEKQILSKDTNEQIVIPVYQNKQNSSTTLNNLNESTANNEEILFALGKKKAEDYTNQLLKRRTDLTPVEIDNIIKFFKDLADPNDESLKILPTDDESTRRDKMTRLSEAKHNNVFIDTCFKWLKNNTANLDDLNTQSFLYKLFLSARYRNIDVQKYKSPLELYFDMMEEAKEDIVDGTPIDPTTIPVFHYNRTEKINGYDIDIYDVEDSKEGQTAVCNVLAASFPKNKDTGKIAFDLDSPWCLSTFNYDVKTGLATPTESATTYWSQYNKGRRQIAFVNNVPIGFNSTENFPYKFISDEDERIYEELYQKGIQICHEWLADDRKKNPEKYKDLDSNAVIEIPESVEKHAFADARGFKKTRGVKDYEGKLDEWWDFNDTSHENIKDVKLKVRENGTNGSHLNKHLEVRLNNTVIDYIQIYQDKKYSYRINKISTFNPSGTSNTKLFNNEETFSSVKEALEFIDKNGKVKAFYFENLNLSNQIQKTNDVTGNIFTFNGLNKSIHYKVDNDKMTFLSTSFPGSKSTRRKRASKPTSTVFILEKNSFPFFSNERCKIKASLFPDINFRTNELEINLNFDIYPAEDLFLNFATTVKLHKIISIPIPAKYAEILKLLKSVNSIDINNFNDAVQTLTSELTDEFFFDFVFSNTTVQLLQNIDINKILSNFSQEQINTVSRKFTAFAESNDENVLYQITQQDALKNVDPEVKKFIEELNNQIKQNREKQEADVSTGQTLIVEPKELEKAEEKEKLFSKVKNRLKTKGKNITKKTFDFITDVIHDTDLAQKQHKYVDEKVDKDLEAELSKILKKYHFEEIEKPLKQVFGDNVMGAIDFLNKIIYYDPSRGMLTQPEEFAHAFIKLMGAVYHGNYEKFPETKTYTELYKLVGNTQIYKEVFEKYKNVYKTAKGDPAIMRIKEEAIGQALSVALTDTWKKKYSKDASFISKVQEFFAAIVRFFKSKISDQDKFEQEIYRIAESILDGTYQRKYLDKIIDNDFKIQTYESAINRISETPEILKMLQDFSQRGFIITGSLAYRKQTPVYRAEEDAMHDFDIIIPDVEFESNLYSTFPFLKDITYQESRNLEADQWKQVITSVPYLKELFDSYPQLEFLYMFPSKDNGGQMIINAIMCEDPDIVERFRNAKGNFNQRLKTFTAEERDKITLFDFFIQNKRTKTQPVTEETADLRLSDFTESFKSKLTMGRAKDIYDYQKLNPSSRRYKQELWNDRIYHPHRNLFFDTQSNENESVYQINNASSILLDNNGEPKIVYFDDQYNTSSLIKQDDHSYYHGTILQPTINENGELIVESSNLSNDEKSTFYNSFVRNMVDASDRGIDLNQMLANTLLNEGDVSDIADAPSDWYLIQVDETALNKNDENENGEVSLENTLTIPEGKYLVKHYWIDEFGNTRDETFGSLAHLNPYTNKMIFTEKNNGGKRAYLRMTNPAQVNAESSNSVDIVNNSPQAIIKNQNLSTNQITATYAVESPEDVIFIDDLPPFLSEDDTLIKTSTGKIQSVQQSIQEIFGDKKRITVDEALENLRKNSNITPLVDLLSKIDNVRDTVIYLQPEVYDSKGRPVNGLFKAQDNVILISQKTTLPATQVVIHEILHKKLAWSLEENPAIKTRLEDIIKRVRRHVVDMNGDPNKYYGLSNAQEFIAEIFTNQNLISLLQEIKSDRHVEHSLFHEFIEWCKNTIKTWFTSDQPTMLDEALNEIETLINYTNEYRGTTTEYLQNQLNDAKKYYRQNLSEFSKSFKTYDEAFNKYSILKKLYPLFVNGNSDESIYQDETGWKISRNVLASNVDSVLSRYIKRQFSQKYNNDSFDLAMAQSDGLPYEFFNELGTIELDGLERFNIDYFYSQLPEIKKKQLDVARYYLLCENDYLPEKSFDAYEKFVIALGNGDKRAIAKMKKILNTMLILDYDLKAQGCYPNGRNYEKDEFGYYDVAKRYAYLDITQPLADQEWDPNDFIKIINHKVYPAEVIAPRMYRSAFKMGNRNLSDMDEKYFEHRAYNTKGLYRNPYRPNERGDVYADLLVRTLDRRPYGIAAITETSPDYGENINDQVIVEDGVVYDNRKQKLFTLPSDAELGKNVSIYRTKNGVYTIGLFASEKHYTYQTLPQAVEEIVQGENNIVSIQPFLNNIFSWPAKARKTKLAQEECCQALINLSAEKTLMKSLKAALTRLATHGPDAESCLDLYNNQEVWYLSEYAKTLYQSFNTTLNIISARIPTQAMQSFQQMKIAGFNNDDTNNIFVTRWQLWLQGSDLDIDKAFLLGYSLDGMSNLAMWSPLANLATEELKEASLKLPMPTSDAIEIINRPEHDQDCEQYQNNYEKILDLHLEKDSDPDVLKQIDALELENLNIITKVLNELKDNNYALSVSSKYENSQLVKDVFKHQAHTPSDEAIKNFMTQAIHNAMSSPRTVVQSQISVDTVTGPLKQAINEVRAENENGKERWIDDGTSIYEMEYQAAMGKDCVGVMANGEKAYFALLQYFNEYYRKARKDGYKGIEDSPKWFCNIIKLARRNNPKKLIAVNTAISDVLGGKKLEDKLNDTIENYVPEKYLEKGLKTIIPTEDAALLISAWGSLAADNAKELALGVVNASVELACIHIYLTIMGFDHQSIVDYTTSPVFNRLAAITQPSAFMGNSGKITSDTWKILKAGTAKYGYTTEDAEQLERLYNYAQETTGLAILFGINQGVSNDPEAIAKKQNSLRNMWVRGTRMLQKKERKQYKYLNKQGYLCVSDNFKYSPAALEKEFSKKTIEAKIEALARDIMISHGFEITNASYNELQMKNHYVDKIKKAIELSCKNNISFSLTQPLDTHRYFADKEYRLAIAEIYDAFKGTFNVFDVFNNSPHFYAMFEAFDRYMKKYTSVNARARFVYEDLEKLLPQVKEVWNNKYESYSGWGEDSTTKQIANVPSVPSTVERLAASRVFEEKVICDLFKEHSLDLNIVTPLGDFEIDRLNTPQKVKQFHTFFCNSLIPQLKLMYPKNPFLMRFIRDMFAPANRYLFGITDNLNKEQTGFEYSFKLEKLIKGFNDLAKMTLGEALSPEYNLIFSGKDIRLGDIFYLYDLSLKLIPNRFKGLGILLNKYIISPNSLWRKFANIEIDYDQGRRKLDIDPHILTLGLYRKVLNSKAHKNRHEGKVVFNDDYTPIPVDRVYLFLDPDQETDQSYGLANSFKKMWESGQIAVNYSSGKWTIKFKNAKDADNKPKTFQFASLNKTNSPKDFVESLKRYTETYEEEKDKLCSLVMEDNVTSRVSNLGNTISVYDRLESMRKKLEKVGISIVEDPNMTADQFARVDTDRDGDSIVIYINPSKTYSSASVGHEFAHVVLSLLRVQNPEAYKNFLYKVSENRLMKQQLEKLNTIDTYQNMMHLDLCEEAFVRLLEDIINPTKIADQKVLKCGDSNIIDEMENTLGDIIRDTFGTPEELTVLGFFKASVSNINEYTSNLVFKTSLTQTHVSNFRIQSKMKNLIQKWKNDGILKEECK